MVKNWWWKMGIRRYLWIWVSAGEGEKFATIANEMTQTIKALGQLKR
jgi:coenzyme F420-reducing hydrogenase delta subunit